MTQALKIFCDGGARGNPGPAAIGFVIYNQQGELIHRQGIAIGKATNNVAEYQGVIHSLKWLKQNYLNKYKPTMINFNLDSKLVVNQLSGLFKIKKPHLQKLVLLIKQLERELVVPVTYCYIPREKNYLADQLLNQALDQLMS
ncbi:ribonuclease HI family protein [Patescibacteria group bacterium]|nr:ribonuclease HI family protein [Patescibacteria group bacterium]MBU1931249.1 ribonuclease HI family protein [Patescibacteria group bacterium]